jgi:hypothetical protein
MVLTAAAIPPSVVLPGLFPPHVWMGQPSLPSLPEADQPLVTFPYAPVVLDGVDGVRSAVAPCAPTT